MLEMADGGTMTMQATAGYIDRRSGLLTLERDIVVTSSTGYKAFLSQAFVDTHNGTVTSDQPVEVKLNQATLKGNWLEVTKSGEIIDLTTG